MSLLATSIGKIISLGGRTLSIVPPSLLFDFAANRGLTLGAGNTVVTMTGINGLVSTGGSLPPVFVPNVINGNGIIRCDGSTNRMILQAINLGTVHTLFLAGKQTTQQDSTPFSGNSNCYCFILYSNGNVGTGSQFYYATASAVVSVYAVWTNSTVLAIRRNGTTVDFFVNGVKIAPSQTLAANENFTLDTFFELSNSGAFFWGGDFYRTIAYTNALSDADVLSRSEAVANDYPSYSGPIVACDGNSLTAAYLTSDASNQSYPALLAAATGLTCVNFGLANQSTEQMISRFAGTVAPWFLVPNTAVVYIAWEGINSMTIGDTPDQAYAAMITLVADARTAGAAYVIVMDMIDCTPSRVSEVNRAAYNALVAANTAGADAVVTLSSIPQLSDCTNTLYFDVDEVHLTSLGLTFVYGAVQPVISSAVPTLPVFTSASSDTFNIATPHTFTFMASNSPTFSYAGPLPGGVTFNSPHLAGSATAGTGGVYNDTVTATNIVGATTQAFMVGVPQAPAITSANSTTFTIGTPSTFTFTASGFPASSFSLNGSLPGGVVFNTPNLSGDATTGTDGTYNDTITATNTVGSATQTFALVVLPAPIVVVEDLFSGSGSLNGRTPDTVNTPGGTWTVTAGSATVSSGSLANGSTGESLANLQFGVSDYTLTVNVSEESGGASGPVVRYVDDNNLFVVVLSNFTNFSLYERVSGTYTLRADSSFPFGSGYYTIKMTISGSTISATVNGGNLISYGSATAGQTSTVGGVRAFDGANIGSQLFQAFKVAL